jgi:polar amino acid transport system substrate-binding protein
MRRMGLAVVAVVIAASLASCAPKKDNGSGSSNSGSSSTTAQSCTPSALKTKTTGTFTFGTDQPVYEPWFVDNKPTNGKGFESAVAYAVATKLGYTQSTVKWVRVGFNAAIAPGPKTFDADINEFSITEARKKAVDFSSGYYDVTQAVIALKGTRAAAAKSVADLKSLKLGAQVGTTSYDAITEVVKPSHKPAVFNNNDDAKAALKNKQIDALVLDLPTAFYVTAAEIDNSTIVGQLPATGGQPEQFGLVLDKGSSLTSCLTKAVDALRADGTLGKLADQWLSEAGAPKLS